MNHSSTTIYAYKKLSDHMAKVHPDQVDSSKQQAVFTLWMKSLILSSNGCAVFDSNGRIVYRVDNYSNKCINQVYLMDATGKLVFTILKKKFCLFGMWEGQRSRDKTRFGVRRKLMGMRSVLGFLRGYSFYKVVIRMEEEKRSCEYIMENQSCKLSCRIVDHLGGLVAEVKRKTSKSGVVLGEDVLTMVVEPHIDHSLIMALVLVLALIHHKL